MPLGETLIQKGHITPGQLELALAEQKKHPEERIGEILIRLGFTSRKDVDNAL